MTPPATELRRSALEELEQAVEPLRRDGLSVETIVRQGNAAHAILREAEQLPFDLVVMGSRGASDFERLVTGSVAEKVLRKAPCPVLTVAPPARDEAASGAVHYDRVLCPVDFSESSLRALEYAFTLAEGASSEVTLLHVRKGVLDVLVPPERRREDEAETMAANEAAGSRLRALLPANAGDFCTPRVLVRRGRPHEQIREVAREEESDVIVLGVDGRGLLGRVLPRSVTSQVVRGASCPVLTVRSKGRAATRARSGDGSGS